MSATGHSVISLTPFTVEFTNGHAKAIKEYQCALTVKEIFNEYDSITFEPKVESTGFYVGDKPKVFVVTIQAYKQEEKKIIVHTFKEALDIQQGASAMAHLMGWTRHSSCGDIISHLDSVFDLFNEGFITVKREL